MGDPADGRAPFDEQAALVELERMREQIQQYRSQRKDVQAEFSRFVRSFRAPPVAGKTPPDAAPVRRRAAPELPPFVTESPPVAAVSLPVAPEPAQAGADSPPVSHEPLPPVPPPTAVRPAPWTRAVVGGGLILLAGGALTTWMLQSDASDPPPSASTAPAAVPATPTPTPAPSAQAPAPAPAQAADPSPHESELATIRRVWMRVTVDGARVLEREVPAGTRVPLTAQKTIVIRTGDAGAVRLSIGGRDQGFLGREGEVITRTFIVPAAPAR